MGKYKIKRHIQVSQEVNLFAAPDHKASRNRQDNMTDKRERQIHKRSATLVWSAQQFNGGFQHI